MINATQLLLKLYTEEDERFGVKYEQGIITNKNKPLVPEDIKKTLLEK
jgi:cilia- and flagella-associated protein 69